MDAKQFPFGANWGGLLGREEWANDFLEMRKIGFNTLRLGMGFPGRRGPRIKSWEDIDEVLDLAHKNGLKVLFTLGTIVLPKEFFARYPDIRFIDIDGQPFPRNIEDLTWPQACFNHPGYRNEVIDFVEAAVKRYRDHPAILAWTVHNEPCNPWGGTGCYCQHTIRVFRGWLEGRYDGNLEEVNRLWGTSYSAWDEVQPPRQWPHQGGNACAWMDWMTFGEWNVTDFVRWEADLVRRLDPQHPVGTNTMGGMLLPITTAQSEKELAKHLDFVGQDWYPSWVLGRRHGEKGQMEKYVGAKLDMTRWAVGSKDTFVAEVQAGPNAESIWFSPDEMRIEGWQAVAHGLKGIYYYRWDPLISGAEPWVHHMRTFEGQVTERIDEAGRLARELSHMSDLIADSDPVQAPVALFYSRPSKIMAQADNLYNPQYRQATLGTYRLFTDNHYPVDWIDGDDILAGKLSGYRVLLLPFIYCLSREIAEAIKVFVREGGIVLAEPFCATRDEHGVTYGEAPGAGLAELFGCRAVESVNYRYWLVGHAVEMGAEGAALTGVKEGAKFWLCGLRERVEVTSGSAQVLFEFIDYPPLQSRSPAAVVNAHGKGKAIYFCAGLGEAYMKMEMPYLRRMIAGLLEWLGVEKLVQVEGCSDSASGDLEIMVLDAGKEADRSVVVINHGQEDVDATLRIKLREEGRLEARELITFNSLPFTREGGRLVLPLDIPGRDVRVYNIYKLS